MTPPAAVLPVHLLERERHDRALLDPLALLDDKHVEAGLGEHRSSRCAAGAGADHQHLGVASRGSVASAIIACRSGR